MILNEWLERLKVMHPIAMDLSLERVKTVAQRLNVLNPNCVVITVGGTNGKGSTVAGLESIYLAEGYRVGAFTSPFLIRYNEYVRIKGEVAPDHLFCEAFKEIEKVRKDITLTMFEYTALATFYIFKQMDLDVWLLEVGLGGRFDAVNVIDADLAIIASIALDHTEWLGNTREEIAFEKAGIFRAGKPALCGDLDPPHTLKAYAKKMNAHLYCQNEHYTYQKNHSNWTWRYGDYQLTHLPLPSLSLQNMANVLMAVHLLQDKKRVTIENIHQGLEQIKLPARIEIVAETPQQIFDVAHNPAAAKLLADWLYDHPVRGTTRAVFSMLSDKDIVTTLQIIKKEIDFWYIADLAIHRAAPLKHLQDAFMEAKLSKVFSYSTILAAYQEAIKQSQKNDRIVVFGSFHTVSQIKNHMSFNNG